MADALLITDRDLTRLLLQRLLPEGANANDIPDKLQIEEIKRLKISKSVQDVKTYLQRIVEGSPV